MTISSDKPVVITGGSGFIGTNLADRLLSDGRRVVLYDNLSRPGVETNHAWLQERYGSAVQLCHADIRDAAAVREIVREASAVFHLAAQVAVTTSLVNPEDDFAINTIGTLNVLNALRDLPQPPPLLFTSTNKVYGGLENVPLRDQGTRYEPENPETKARGISESQLLNFCSPYGCSKGAADQYVLDYSRTFGLPAVVFRMSCIYGPHQFGTEDQGWVAHFLIQAKHENRLTIYGDGRQVRDILFVDDLVDAMLLAVKNIDDLTSQAFNIGGGPQQAVSLLELLATIGELNGAKAQVDFEDWRVGDQQYYVTDHARFTAATGWKPRVPVSQGMLLLDKWLNENVVLANPILA